MSAGWVIVINLSAVLAALGVLGRIGWKLYGMLRVLGELVTLVPQHKELVAQVDDILARLDRLERARHPSGPPPATRHRRG